VWKNQTLQKALILKKVRIPCILQTRYVKPELAIHGPLKPTIYIKEHNLGKKGTSKVVMQQRVKKNVSHT
jgi:hypothetical protein